MIVNRPTERSRRRRAVVVLAVWLVLVALWVWQLRTRHLGPTTALQQLVESARGAWWAALGYVGLSLVRPLVFLPATLLTVAAGVVFGPVAGVALAVVGANGAALVGYAIGASLGPDALRADDVRREGGGLASLAR